MLSLVLAAVAVAAYLRWGPAPADVGRQIAAVSPWSWLLAALGMVLSYWLRALRLHSEWHSLVGVSRRECLRIAVLHTAAVNVLPLRSGEASFPFLLQRRWQVPLLNASLSLLWMRIQDICVVAVFAAFAFTTGPVWLRLMAALAVVGFVMLGWRASHANRLAAAFELRGGDHPPTGRRRRLGSLIRSVRAASGQSRGGARAWRYCLLIWTTKFSVLFVLLLQLSGLAPADALGGVLGGEFAAALPLQPALAAGTYETGVLFGTVFGHTSPGADSAATISAAVALHLFMLAMSLLAGLLALLTDSEPRLDEGRVHARGESGWR